MKSIIFFNNDILEDYSSFNQVNDNWNMLSYLNYKYDVNVAIAFSKLFYPDFLEVSGCIILSFLYNESNFKEWYNDFEGNIPEIEKMCNLYELKDFFHINDQHVEQNKLIIFGEVLKRSWEVNLSLLFPEKNFTVEIFEEYESYYITYYSNPIRTKI